MRPQEDATSNHTTAEAILETPQVWQVVYKYLDWALEIVHADTHVSKDVLLAEVFANHLLSHALKKTRPSSLPAPFNLPRHWDDFQWKIDAMIQAAVLAAQGSGVSTNEALMRAALLDDDRGARAFLMDPVPESVQRAAVRANARHILSIDQPTSAVQCEAARLWPDVRYSMVLDPQAQMEAERESNRRQAVGC